MAKRKSRLPEGQLPTAEKPKATVQYRDAFQRESEKRIGNITDKLEGKGKTILYALGAIVVVTILIGIIYSCAGGTRQSD